MRTSGQIQGYSLLPLWNSMKRRLADAILHFRPWGHHVYVVDSLRFELTFLRVLVGNVRLQTGELPPFSTFIWTVQMAIHGDPDRKFPTLPGEAIKLLTGSEGPEPIDTTNFPRWWYDAPRDLTQDHHARPPFNISLWILDDSSSEMRRRAEAETEVGYTLFVFDFLGTELN
ncbi:unnamed protein product [Peniophora sp. CBMAI 1063]|nr:unnamed protein product [Peniophora sp. CBMAI 1063]